MRKQVNTLNLILAEIPHTHQRSTSGNYTLEYIYTRQHMIKIMMSQHFITSLADYVQTRSPIYLLLNRSHVLKTVEQGSNCQAEILWNTHESYNRTLGYNNWCYVKIMKWINTECLMELRWKLQWRLIKRLKVQFYNREVKDNHTCYNWNPSGD